MLLINDCVKIDSGLKALSGRRGGQYDDIYREHDELSYYITIGFPEQIVDISQYLKITDQLHASLLKEHKWCCLIGCGAAQ